MSKLKNKSEISGLLGEQVSIRKVNGSVVIKNRPARIQKSTDGQKVVIDKFTEGSQWAAGQMAIPDAAKLYGSGITPKLKSAYVVALTDFLTAPQVKLIDTDGYAGEAGNTIVVKAVDDFMVTKVMVTVTDAAGNLIERGAATKDAENALLWNYAATVKNPALAGTKISASASDRPGNKTTLEKLL